MDFIQIEHCIRDDQMENSFLHFRRIQIALDIRIILWVQQTHISDAVLTSTFQKVCCRYKNIGLTLICSSPSQQ